MTDEGARGDSAHQVILFRPRAGTSPGKSAGGARPNPLSVPDLTEFEQSGEQDDYRHRMLVNTVALAFTLLLVGAGIWIAESMAVTRKNQDCVLMGRSGCSPVEVPLVDRWSETVSGPRP
jgi:hypothetical protein